MPVLIILYHLGSIGIAISLAVTIADAEQIVGIIRYPLSGAALILTPLIMNIAATAVFAGIDRSCK